MPQIDITNVAKRITATVATISDAIHLATMILFFPYRVVRMIPAAHYCIPRQIEEPAQLKAKGQSQTAIIKNDQAAVSHVP